jgi:hypothetical protein
MCGFLWFALLLSGFLPSFLVSVALWVICLACTTVRGSEIVREMARADCTTEQSAKVYSRNCIPKAIHSFPFSLSSFTVVSNPCIPHQSCQQPHIFPHRFPPLCPRPWFSQLATPLLPSNSIKYPSSLYLAYASLCNPLLATSTSN